MLPRHVIAMRERENSLNTSKYYFVVKVVLIKVSNKAMYDNAVNHTDLNLCLSLILLDPRCITLQKSLYA